MPQLSLFQLHCEWQRRRRNFSDDTGMRIDVATDSMFALLNILEQMNNSGLSARPAEIETRVKGIIGEIVSAACSLMPVNTLEAEELQDQPLFTWKDALYGAWSAPPGSQSTPKATRPHLAPMESKQHAFSIDRDDPASKTFDLDALRNTSAVQFDDMPSPQTKPKDTKSMGKDETVKHGTESRDYIGQALNTLDRDQSSNRGPHPIDMEVSEDDDSNAKLHAESPTTAMLANASANKSAKGASARKPGATTPTGTPKDRRAGRGDLTPEDDDVKSGSKRSRQSDSTVPARAPPVKRKRGLGSLYQKIE